MQLLQSPLSILPPRKGSPVMKKVAALLALALASVALVACGSSSDNSTTTTERRRIHQRRHRGRQQGRKQRWRRLDRQIRSRPGRRTRLHDHQSHGQSRQGDGRLQQPPGTDPRRRDRRLKRQRSRRNRTDRQWRRLDHGRPQTGHLHFFCTVPGHREAGMEGTLPSSRQVSTLAPVRRAGAIAQSSFRARRSRVATGLSLPQPHDPGFLRRRSRDHLDRLSSRQVALRSPHERAVAGEAE